MGRGGGDPSRAGPALPGAALAAARPLRGGTRQPALLLRLVLLARDPCALAGGAAAAGVQRARLPGGDPARAPARVRAPGGWGKQPTAAAAVQPGQPPPLPPLGVAVRGGRHLAI